MHKPARPGCLAMLALAAALAMGVLWLGCARSPVEPASELGFAVPPIAGQVHVRNYTTAPFDADSAARGIRKGYDRIATGAESPSYVYGQSLDGLRIGVYAALGPPYSQYPSVYMPDRDECQLVAGYEALAEGCILHRLCDQTRVYQSAPGCHWSSALGTGNPNRLAPRSFEARA